MSAGIFLVNAGSRIVHVNKAGEALLAEDDAFTARSGIFVCREQSANMALAAALADVHRTSDDGVAVPIGGRTGTQYVLHVLPMTSGLRRHIGAGYAAAAAIFVRKASVSWASPVETLAKVYKLTPSEIRVLLAVAEEDGSTNIAATLGISEDTVKTHLRHIYDKTGKRRQADLVKLLAEFVGTSP